MSAAIEDMVERVLDRTVARRLADSPRARELCAALAGRTLAIEVRGTPWISVWESSGKALRRRPAGTGAPCVYDARIVGAPLSLLALAAQDPQSVIRRGDVRVDGDVEIAQQFRELAALLKPDLEAALGQLLGRSAAHIAARGARGAWTWLRAAAWTSVQNLAEYLAHERRDLVSRAEAEHFLRAVEGLREDLDRLDARLRPIEQRAVTLAGEGEPAG